MRRGLRGVKLVISDAHEGPKAANAKVLHASWRRCRVHFMRNMRNVLACAPKGQRPMVSALVGTIFAQPIAEAARAQWRVVVEQLESRFPKIAALRNAAEADVLAYLGFPREHRTKLYSTNPLERLNKEITPTSSESSPTMRPSCVLSGRCCSSTTTNGRSSAATSPWKRWRPSATIRGSRSRRSRADRQASDVPNRRLTVASYTTPWDTTVRSSATVSRRTRERAPVPDLSQQSPAHISAARWSHRAEQPCPTGDQATPKRNLLAEREGFEPPDRSRGQLISSQPRSATPAPLREACAPGTPSRSGISRALYLRF